MKAFQAKVLPASASVSEFVDAAAPLVAPIDAYFEKVRNHHSGKLACSEEVRSDQAEACLEEVRTCMVWRACTSFDAFLLCARRGCGQCRLQAFVGGVCAVL